MMWTSRLPALILIWLLASQSAQADNSYRAENSYQLGDHTLYYTLFNSTFIPAEVASRYQIKRSPYEWLLNVVVSREGEHGGVPVALSGTSKNLMAQQKKLTFQEISEQDTVYYLAPVRVNGEEVLHFELQVTLPDGSAHTLKFTDKVISD